MQLYNISHQTLIDILSQLVKMYFHITRVYFPVHCVYPYLLNIKVSGTIFCL